MTFSRLTLVLALAAPWCIADEGFNGRWNVHPVGHEGGRVMWLEGAGGGAIGGSAVGFGPGGWVNELASAHVEDGLLHFAVEWRLGAARGNRLVRTPSKACLLGGQLHGVTYWDGEERRWVGHRAPRIDDRDDGTWRKGEPAVLFDGTDLAAWRTNLPGREEDWFVEAGVLKNRAGADVLESKDRFWNFQLDVEYRVMPGKNSGIALRGRYEVQILDDHGEPPSKSGNGGVYGRIAPAVNASKPAGEWQTFAITLIGRDLTVVLNGVKVIDKKQVDGFTAMATDWREGEPGPVTLQGDHGDVEVRKIVLTPLVR